jgi:hypothetical protein
MARTFVWPGAKFYVGLGHKHSNKEGTRRNTNFVTSHAKVMLWYIKINCKNTQF